MSYLLNGVEISRPRSFSRHALLISTDGSMLDGTTKRDITGRKESFSLEWVNMSKTEFDALLAIVELNTAVSFSVLDGSLEIAETQVIPKLGQVEYSTPGSDYRSRVSIDLIEVA